MTRAIEIIVIPSGTFRDDHVRLKKAREYARGIRGRGVRYIISGIGPDLNQRLEQVGGSQHGMYQREICYTEGLKIHPELWDESIRHFRRNNERIGKFEPFGVDILSL